jgi:hypothetical protein
MNRFPALPASTIALFVVYTGRPGYIGRRNRFLGSINVYRYGLCWGQWGRRLEGWLNTAARLAGWRGVTQQVWFCTGCPDRSCPAAVNVHNNHPSWAKSRKEGMAWWYSSKPMPSLWLGILLYNIYYLFLVGWPSRPWHRNIIYSIRCHVVMQTDSW